MTDTTNALRAPLTPARAHQILRKLWRSELISGEEAEAIAWACDMTAALATAQPEAKPEGVDLPREDETEDEYLIRRLSTLLAEIAVIVKGPAPALTSWGYQDLPDLVRALKDRVPPDRKLPPNPPPAKPVRVVVTHEVAERGPNWLREDMLALADLVERGEATGVEWPATIREWAAALATRQAQGGGEES